MSVILDTETPSRKEADRSMVQKPIAGPQNATFRLGTCLLAASCGILLAPIGHAAELLSAASASITPADAARHVQALADDAFEGREGGTRGGRAAAAYIVDQIAPLGFEPAGDNGSSYQLFGAGLRNVLALLPGSDPELANEVVVIGAHYDHVGYGTTRNSFGPFGFVHNGADDNASGVAGLIEVMEAVLRLPEPPRRSILFAFWDGEEQGLLGSRHFLRVRPQLLAGKRLVFGVNLDMIGRLRDRRLTVYGIRTASGLRARLVAANNAAGNGSGLELAFDWEISEDSDHYAFIAAGIPTIMLHTGLHDQYHRPSDDVEHVNFDGIPAVSRLALGLVQDVANGDHAPIFRLASRTESNVTRRQLEESRPANRPARGRWGILSRSDAAEPSMPVILDVARGSPAEMAGLRAGDRLLAIEGNRLEDQNDMIGRLTTSGSQCQVEVDRRGLVVVLQLDEETE